jgi:hypothetical protein
VGGIERRLNEREGNTIVAKDDALQMCKLPPVSLDKWLP